VKAVARIARRLADGFASLRPTGEPTAGPDLMWRFTMVGGVALLTLALFPPRTEFDLPSVRAGQIASEDVIAPFDFRILLDDETLAEQQEAAAAAVPPVYSAVPDAAGRAIERVEEYLERVERISAGEAVAEEATLEMLNRVDGHGLGLQPVELRALTDPATRQVLLRFAREALPEVYEQHRMLDAEMLEGIESSRIAVQRPDSSEVIVPTVEIVGLRPRAEVPSLAERTGELSPYLERLAVRLLPGLMPGNLEPRPALTAIRRQEARRAVSPVAGEVLRGELIIGAHTRVTPEEETRLRALASELERRRGGFGVEEAQMALGAMFLNAALLLLFGFYLLLYRRDVFEDFRSLATLTIVWALVIGLAAFVEGVDNLPSYAVPVALGSLLVAILWNTQLSAVWTLFAAAYLTGQGELGLPVLWIGLLGGLGGAWSVRRIRRRTHFYESLLFIGVGHMIAVGTIGLAESWRWLDFGVGLGWIWLSAALAVFLAMGLLPVLEWASGRTTDLTLLELADLNRPHLKQLLLDAPGTYHHSVVVASLAESAAERIGANSLLARVGAYYHDIGKCDAPGYFAENQSVGINPHDALDPRESARIVIGHVTTGVEKARAANLPDEVIDFIREHHGTTRLEYFWHRAEEKLPDDELHDGDFRYPGPRPRSKETALVMLADSVEATSRVVHEPSEERFRDVVHRTIEAKLEAHQFDEADLTLRELAVVEDAFVGVLCGIHHNRIEYPSFPVQATRPQDDTQDSVPSIGRSTA